MDLQTMGRIVLLLGLAMVIAGGLLLLGSRLGLGSLPGNVRVGGQNWSCYLPIAASILLSLLLTLIVNVLWRLFSK
jgi:hypothetical protein